MLLLLLLACQPTPDTRDSASDGAFDPIVPLHGIRGTEGVLLWTDSDLPTQVGVQRADGGSWIHLGSGGHLWWDPHAPASAVYRLEDGDGEPGPTLVPGAVALELGSSRTDGLWHAGDPVSLVAKVQLPDEPPGLSLALARDGSAWLDPGGAGWVAEPVPVDLPTGGTFPFPTFPAQTGQPATVPFTAQVLFAWEGTWTPLSTDDLEQIFLGGLVLWGDLHAHSNLSMDGCETPPQDLRDLCKSCGEAPRRKGSWGGNPERESPLWDAAVPPAASPLGETPDACADAGDGPGATFFENARALGLDFAALVDHAECVQRYDDASCTEGQVDLWQRAQERVQAAEGTGILPILGFEWTWDGETDDDSLGGHKTVLLEGTSACPDFHVGAKTTLTWDNGSYWYVGPNPRIGQTPNELWQMLDQARSDCGEQRVLTFFHHTGIGVPQPVDWTRPENQPDPRYETLVELDSEHGSSECRDRDAVGCAWHLGQDNTQFNGATGGVQVALSLGYKLGFTGGTDAHDGRPGSVEDGPSCAGSASGQTCLSYGGSLTGVLALEATRSGLFDALFARHTLVTTSPRLPVRAALVSADGGVALPGDTVPAGPGTLRVSVEGLLDGDTSVLALELMDPVTGGPTLSTDAESLALETDLAPGTSPYVRLRLLVSGTEQRMWLSPWFVDEAGSATSR